VDNFFHKKTCFSVGVCANLWELMEKKGKNSNKAVSILYGDFECTLDDKGRILLPLALKKQLPEHAQGHFVIARGTDEHAAIYPYNVWMQFLQKLGRLNHTQREVREYVRMATTHSMEVHIDNSGRLLLPKSLIAEAKIKKDIVLKGSAYMIEVWSKEIHDKLYGKKNESFAELSQTVGAGIDLSDFQF
jgi:MraZ protein